GLLIFGDGVVASVQVRPPVPISRRSANRDVPDPRGMLIFGDGVIAGSDSKNKLAPQENRSAAKPKQRMASMFSASSEGCRGFISDRPRVPTHQAAYASRHPPAILSRAQTLRYIAKANRIKFPDITLLPSCA